MQMICWFLHAAVLPGIENFHGVTSMKADMQLSMRLLSCGNYAWQGAPELLRNPKARHQLVQNLMGMSIKAVHARQVNDLAAACLSLLRAGHGLPIELKVQPGACREALHIWQCFLCWCTACDGKASSMLAAHIDMLTAALMRHACGMHMDIYWQDGRSRLAGSSALSHKFF